MITDPSNNPPKSKKGCFFYGCLTLCILALLAGTAVFFGARYALGRVSEMIVQYTDDTQMPLPKLEMPADQIAEVVKRYNEFKSAVDAHKSTPPLVLTGDDINALIEGHPEWQPLKGNAYVTIAGSELSAQVSIPTDSFPHVPGLSRVRGRYLNGSAAVNVTMMNGALFVTLKSIEIKGQSPPEEAMVRWRTKNLAENISQGGNGNQTINRLESAEVKDGVLTLKAKE